MDNEYLTPTEVARLLKVNPRTVLRMIENGKILAVELAGTKRKTYRILSGELDRFVSREYEKNKDVEE